MGPWLNHQCGISIVNVSVCKTTEIVSGQHCDAWAKKWAGVVAGASVMGSQ